MISCKGLTRRRGRRTVLDDVSFDVAPGKVTGFLGPNGAGKSTTMRVILGLERPQAGAALVDGLPYHRLRVPLRTVGGLTDTPAFLPGRRAVDHLRWVAAAARLPRQRVEQVLDDVGLSADAGRRVREFSLGMRQRLGLATALLGDPAALLLDEPVNGLDPEGVRWIRGLMRSLAREGRAVLVSSHLMAETASCADQILVLDRGRVVADAPLRTFAPAGTSLEDAYFTLTARTLEVVR